MDVQQYYRKRAACYDKEAKWILGDSKLLNLHKRMVQIESCKSVIDVATGTGVMGSIFMGGSNLVVGIDVSSSMLTQAKVRMENLVKGSGENLPFRDNSFDLVICRQGLHYMNPQTALGEFYRVCRNQAVVSQITCFSQEDAKWWWFAFRILSPGRKYIFTQDSIAELIAGAGFFVVSCVKYKTKNSLKDWAKTLEDQVKLRKLLRRFSNAPNEIKKLYSFKLLQDDCLFEEPWVIFTGYKKPKELGI